MRKNRIEYYVKKVPTGPEEYEAKSLEDFTMGYVEWKKRIYNFYINDKVLEAENPEMYSRLTDVKLTEKEIELLEREYTKGKKEIILGEDLSSNEYELD